MKRTERIMKCDCSLKTESIIKAIDRLNAKLLESENVGEMKILSKEITNLENLLAGKKDNFVLYCKYSLNR